MQYGSGSPVDPGFDGPGAVIRWIRAVLRFTVEQLVPVALTAGLNLATRLGLLTLLPLTVLIEREYGNFALLLGCTAALVASATFGRISFDLPVFVSTAVAGIVMAAPFVLGPAGITLGLSPRQFDILATFAYLGFFLVIGVLIGGCWSVVVRSLREAAAR